MNSLSLNTKYTLFLRESVSYLWKKNIKPAPKKIMFLWTTHPSSHSSTNPLTHPSNHSSTHPSTHSSIQSFIHQPTHSSIQPFIHTSIHSLIHPSTHSSIHPPIHPSIHPIICLSICLFVCLSKFAIDFHWYRDHMQDQNRNFKSDYSCDCDSVYRYNCCYVTVPVIIY